MKFVKSSLAKKLIIVLVALMIFNIAIPTEANAGILDGLVNAAGGILFIPTKLLLLGFLSNININLGIMLTGATNTVKGVLETFDSQSSVNQYAWDDVKQTVGSVFIGPEDIFSGSVEIFNADVFDSIDDNLLGKIINVTASSLDPSSSILTNVRKTVASLYLLLRNICALIMLAGLVYTGIRILVTSNIPSKKKQYLMLLEDWLMGMVLLLFSHIIMIGIFELSEMFISIFSSALKGGSSGLSFTLAWGAFTNVGFNESVTYLMLYAYMTWLVIVFAISYFKRFFWIVVLTIFAPVVSIMYAFGQQTKQIYTRWLKEYIMTVFTQPFHMLVYYILVMIPVGIVGAQDGNIFNKLFNMDTNLFTLFYALVAISFIRPAEKYLRELFGMDKGIAGAGSYDSGIAPIKAAASTAMKVGAIAATAAGAPMVGAAMSAVVGGGNGGGTDDDGATLPEEDKDDYDYVDSLMNEQAMKRYMDAGKKGGGPVPTIANGTPEGFNPAAQPIEGFLKSHPEYDNRLARENGAEEVGNNSLNTGSGNSGTESINASNVVINSSNVDIQGGGSGASLANSAAAEIAEGTAPSDSTSSTESNNEQDDNFEIDEGKNKITRRVRDFIPMSIAGKHMGAARDMLLGKRSIVDAVSSPYEWLGKKTGLSGGRFSSKVGKIRDFAKRFEAAGGFTELYKGFNSVRDTMFINGAPGDWKDTAAQMDENKKIRDEKAVFNFANSRENKSYVEALLRVEAKEKYKNDLIQQQKYVDANLDSRVQSLAKAYAPLGITDARIAYSLKQDQKAYGYTPEEAIRQANKFNSFDSSSRNISVVNNEYKLGNSTTNVSTKIPDAKDYFNRGITDISTMISADKIAVALSQRLGDKLSKQMRTDIATAVAKKGGVSYGGNNEDIRKVIDELTKKG